MEYSFFWSGKPEGERKEAGVGFAIKKDKADRNVTAVSDRFMTMRTTSLQLSAFTLQQ